MQYVDFFGHKVSKLIVGDNPFNGHSYITEYITGKEMRDYHTEDRILEAMHKMEEMGINTMLPLADPYIIRILEHYRNNGGKMNFIFQTYGPMMLNYDIAQISIRAMMNVEPIGIYLSGTYTDVRFETERNHEIVGMLKLLKSSGTKIGLGTHRPNLVKHCENENWDIDFYMACMYNGRKNREGEESGFVTGKSKLGLVFDAQDRAVMLDTLKDVKKPIIAFKIFAGGQMLVEKTQEEKEAAIIDAYDTIFTSLKPNDFGVMGVFQKNFDQIEENVRLFNKWEASK